MHFCISHRRGAKAQASLRIRAVSPEPSLLAYTMYNIVLNKRRAKTKEAGYVSIHVRLEEAFAHMR